MPHESANPFSPPLVIFISLQALDVLTTMMGLRLGAHESSFFISRLLNYGPLTGLLMSKVISLVLIGSVVAMGRIRLLHRLNLWYAALVTWNLAMILLAVLRGIRL